MVDAGSRYEVEYTSGVSHFLQKLAFQVSATLSFKPFGHYNAVTTWPQITSPAIVQEGVPA